MIGFKNIQYHYNLCEKDTNYLASHILRLSLQERWEVCRRCKRQFQKRIGDGVSLGAVEATTSAAVLRLSDEKRAELEGGGAVAAPGKGQIMISITLGS